MRVYLPSTLPALTAALKAGEIGPAPIAGFAVTPALREGYASGDLEELEYVALMEAARAALRLLAGDPDAPARRVVLVAEVSGNDVGRSGEHQAAVQILSAIPFTDVAAGHVDDPDAVRDVRAAVAAVRPRTRAMTTPGSQWTAPKATSFSGTPARNWSSSTEAI